MKKQRKAPKPRKQRAAKTTPTSTPDADRRATLRLLRNAAIAVPFVGVAGVLTTRHVRASICELDLTKIGNGVPSIVQIHDPSCSLCATLQRQTRRALRAYDADGHNFLIANTSSLDGRLLAERYGVSHVTLILFDATGQATEIVTGPLSDDAVEAAIASHLGPAI